MDVRNTTSVPADLIESQLHLSLTICFTVFYSLVFIAAYIQLWLILYLNHKLVSAQTIYFLLCCIFTSLRIVLFSFFYTKHKNGLDGFMAWFFEAVPIIVQYVIVLLITIFYYKTYRKTKGLSFSFTKFHYLLIALPLFIISILHLMSIWIPEPSNVTEQRLFPLLAIRILVTDIIFIGTISFFIYIYRQFPKFPNAMLVHEAKRITKTRSAIVGAICIFVCILKLVYDVIALVYKDWSKKLPTSIEKSDFISPKNDDNILPFAVFGTVLFLWEVLPLIAAMILFSVALPKGYFKLRKTNLNKVVNSSIHSSSVISSSSSTPKSKFIGVPKYGTINSFASPTDHYSGPLSPNFLGSPIFAGVQRQNDAISTSTNAARNHLSNYLFDENFTNQPGSLKQNPHRLKRPINHPIWRSSSNKVLNKSNIINERGIVKANSSHLSTANEE